MCYVFFSVFSFTWEMWVYMPTGYTTDFIPLICNYDSTLCMYLQGHTLHATVGEFTASGTTTIPALSWTHVAVRFDAEGCNLDIYVNGTGSGAEATVAGVAPVDWEAVANDVNISSQIDLYMGFNGNQTFEGIVDEVRRL